MPTRNRSLTQARDANVIQGTTKNLQNTPTIPLGWRGVHAGYARGSSSRAGSTPPTP